MDQVVEKATELGVRRIVPVLTRRVVVRLAGERGRQRAAHWQKIAEAACEQCGLNRVPRVESPLPLEEALATPTLVAGTGLWLDPEAATPLGALADRPDAVTLLVGPEGGFDPRESERLQAAPWRRVTLGPRVLRADTAGLAATSILTALFDRAHAPQDR